MGMIGMDKRLVCGKVCGKNISKPKKPGTVKANDLLQTSGSPIPLEGKRFENNPRERLRILKHTRPTTAHHRFLLVLNLSLEVVLIAVVILSWLANR